MAGPPLRLLCKTRRRTWKNERIDGEIAAPAHSGSAAGATSALSYFFPIPYREYLDRTRLIGGDLAGGLHLSEPLSLDIPISLSGLYRFRHLRHLSAGLYCLHWFHEIQLPKPPSLRPRGGFV